MTLLSRIEKSLTQTMARGCPSSAPPKLAAAMKHAVFPGGARIRPKLCLSVSLTCGDSAPGLADAAASAIELLHCASLVHDDMPCFDDADIRRGKPSVHCAYGEPLALLTGDALIVMAFETVARCIEGNPDRAAAVMRTIAGGVGMPFGIVAGQAWESEDDAILADYQRAKTGSLFAAASAAGAAAAGADGALWRILGERLGEAFQVADDLKDVLCDKATVGKPTGRDVALGRPNAVAVHGVDGATKHLKNLVKEAVDSVPPSPGREALCRQILEESREFIPRTVAVHAA